MILALSACIGMTLAAFFTVLRTFSKKLHPNGSNKPWNGGYLDRLLVKTEIWLQSVERLPMITRNVYYESPENSPFKPQQNEKA
jgi:hypothetical protein